MTVGQTDGLEKHIEELEYENARLMKKEHERKECEHKEWQLAEFGNISIFVLVYLGVVYLMQWFAWLAVIVITKNTSMVFALLLVAGFIIAKVFLYFFGVWVWLMHVGDVYHYEIREFASNFKKRFRRAVRALHSRV